MCRDNGSWLGAPRGCLLACRTAVCDAASPHLIPNRCAPSQFRSKLQRSKEWIDAADHCAQPHGVEGRARTGNGVAAPVAGRCRETVFREVALVQAVSGHLHCRPSRRDLKVMVRGRGLKIDHKSISRRVPACAPPIGTRVRPLRRPRCGSVRNTRSYETWTKWPSPASV